MKVVDERVAQIWTRVMAATETGEWRIRTIRREGHCACVESVKAWDGGISTIAHLEHDTCAELLVHAREDLRDLLLDREELTAQVRELEAELQRARRSLE